MTQLDKQFDYIIAGGGLSGLALGLKLMEKLPNKRFVIVDKDLKKDNDRTWSFWAIPDGSFPNIATKTWKKIKIADRQHAHSISIAPYEYSTIQGIDFYNFAKERLQDHPNVKFVYDTIHSVDPKAGTLKTKGGKAYEGKMIFKSYFEAKDIHIPSTYPLLHQQFKGWVIETPSAVFDESTVTMMDFDSPSDASPDLRFFYVLPFAPNKALVEYTIFAKQHETELYYDRNLIWYIKEKLGIKQYEITESEFNSIPMTNYPFDPIVVDKVVHIGTIGGFVKPSSGYAFTRTFRKVEQIVNTLVQKDSITSKSFRSAYKYRLFDSVLLNLLYHYRVNPEIVFTNLYTKLPPSVLFRFLDEEAYWSDILRVMLVSPEKHKYGYSFFKQLLSTHRI